MHMRSIAVLFCLFITQSFVLARSQQSPWSSGLDSKINFYQTTDFGTLLVGTEKSLYSLDGRTGEKVWRISTGKINSTAVTPVPETDVLLLTRDEGSKSRLIAIDILTGEKLWESDKVKGDVMQLAVDPARDAVAVVMIKGTRGKAGDTVKRTPVIHTMRLSTGDEIWKRDLDSEVEMMPSRYGENLGEIDFTLDNYRAPLMADGRLFIFYDGVTSYDVEGGREKQREKFKINEGGLALTEADPVIDDKYVYVSGRGRVRAVDRRSGEVAWKADDLGTASEMAVVGTTLYVRTGGQFTRLKDGEIETKGPYGVSAIDTKNGKTLWRYKGADKGLTNFAFSDVGTILIADKDDVVTIDARTGKRLDSFEHNVERAQFILINDTGFAVVGGRDEIAAFDIRGGRRAGMEMPKMAFGFAENAARGNRDPVWRVKHRAPSRGILRTIAGVALRATALYFRYGGVATSAFSTARTGFRLYSAVNSFRVSGLATRFGSFDLTTLASNAIRGQIQRQIYAFGSLAQTPSIGTRVGINVNVPQMIRSKIQSRVRGAIIDKATPSRESIIDRIDPANLADKLADYLFRKKRLAELRGDHMYYYTELPKPYGGRGLIGISVHDGRDSRYVQVNDPDPMFVTDDNLGMLYSSDGTKLRAFLIVRGA